MLRTEIAYFIGLYENNRVLVVARLGDAYAVSALTKGEGATGSSYTSFSLCERAVHPTVRPKRGDMVLVTYCVTESGFTAVPPHLHEVLEAIRVVVLPADMAESIHAECYRQEYPSAPQP